MTTNKPPGHSNPTPIRDFIADPITRYTLIVSLSISFILLVDTFYPYIVQWLSSIGWRWLEENYPSFVTPDDQAFSQGFVEWFGTFYGFFLPLLLVRAWEQLDQADREFDREADSIKVLLEDIMLLDKDFLEFKKRMVKMLGAYVQHVLENYQIEHLKEKTTNINKDKPASEPSLKTVGDNLLQGIRSGYKELIYRGGGDKARQLEPMTTELLERLNEAIDIRGDRIATFDERLFDSMKTVAIVTSVIWLIPFYFLPWELSGLGGLLKLAVTFLIIFILSIIDDLDKPFDGVWKISTATWVEVKLETELALTDLEKPEGQSANTAPEPMKVDDGKNGVEVPSATEMALSAPEKPEGQSENTDPEPMKVDDGKNGVEVPSATEIALSAAEKPEGQSENTDPEPVKVDDGKNGMEVPSATEIALSAAEKPEGQMAIREPVPDRKADDSQDAKETGKQKSSTSTKKKASRKKRSK